MKHKSLLTGFAGLALGVGATLLILMVDRAGDPSDEQPDIRSALSREQVNQIETQAAKLDENIQLATEKITDRDTQIFVLQQHIVDLKAEVESSRTVPEADILPAPAIDTTTAFSKNMNEYMDKMMDSEAGKATMRAEIMQRLEIRYAELIATLQLSDAQTGDFFGLIADKELRGLRDMQFSGPDMKINKDGTLNLSLEEDTLAKIKQEETVLNNKIQALLGEQGYEYYKTYERTSEDRQIVSVLENAVSDSVLPLDAVQKEQLLWL